MTTDGHNFGHDTLTSLCLKPPLRDLGKLRGMRPGSGWVEGRKEGNGVILLELKM